MSASGPGRGADILNLPYGSAAREGGRRGSVEQAEPGAAEAAAISEATLARLRQMADAARRNEERAKAQAQALVQKLDAAEARMRSLESELRWLRHRAAEAEQWLEKVLHEARETLYEPLALRGRTEP